jgi:hypothetical protein
MMKTEEEEDERKRIPPASVQLQQPSLLQRRNGGILTSHHRSSDGTRSSAEGCVDGGAAGEVSGGGEKGEYALEQVGVLQHVLYYRLSLALLWLEIDSVRILLDHDVDGRVVKIGRAGERISLVRG